VIELTFEELYQSLMDEEFGGKVPEKLEVDPYHLDCLLHPEKHPVVIKTESCSDCEGGHPCRESCVFDAIVDDGNGGLTIDKDKCTGCAVCIDACKSGKLIASRDILPAMKAVRHSGKRAYALVAPAFHGQFSHDVSPGMLRSAFKKVGFTGMIEVALFADILTLKEALEFDRHVNSENDYQLTSCCCPMWIAMIKKIYNELMPHVPGAVSPMIACGRVIKKLYPDAITVFIGPCLAKKSEAREPDVSDAIDFVLTFQEVQDIFNAANITLSEMDDTDKDHSSRAGRIYAAAGGVSEAVQKTLERLNPDRKIKIKTVQADGVPACREMIEKLKSGELEGNFFEGMGCVGGCVGGPKSIIDPGEGRVHIMEYGDDATYLTPAENPYVVELLKRLGLNTVHDLLEKSDIFTREF